LSTVRRRRRLRRCCCRRHQCQSLWLLINDPLRNQTGICIESPAKRWSNTKRVNVPNETMQQLSVETVDMDGMWHMWHIDGREAATEAKLPQDEQGASYPLCQKVKQNQFINQRICAALKVSDNNSSSNCQQQLATATGNSNWQQQLATGSKENLSLLSWRGLARLLSAMSNLLCQTQLYSCDIFVGHKTK